MGQIVEKPRYICALGGAVATINGLDGVIPILHAAAGCGFNISNALNGGGGYAGSAYCGGHSVSSSNVYENEIVFGGEERLKEQVKNTFEVIDGKIYFIVSGCMVEIIGDDVKGVARKFRDGKERVLAADTGGFKGNSYKGYDLVLKTVTEEFIEKKSEKKAKTVNLLGIVPIQDVFWKGNIKEIKRVLEKLGVKVNSFFGEGEKLEDIKNYGEAELTVVLSEIYGEETAKAFEEEHGIPFIKTSFPVGAYATEKFIREIAEKLKLDEKIVEEVIDYENKLYFNYLERLADAYNDFDLQRYSVVVGDANYVEGVSKFLADDLGWLPQAAIVTDLIYDEEKDRIRERFNNFTSGYKPSLYFDTNASSVAKYIKKEWPNQENEKYKDGFNPGFIIGSSYERNLAEDLGVSYLSVTYPVSNRAVLNRGYAGYNGGLALAEDIFGILLGGR